MSNKWRHHSAQICCRRAAMVPLRAPEMPDRPLRFQELVRRLLATIERTVEHIVLPNAKLRDSALSRLSANDCR